MSRSTIIIVAVLAMILAMVVILSVTMIRRPASSLSSSSSSSDTESATVGTTRLTGESAIYVNASLMATSVVVNPGFTGYFYNKTLSTWIEKSYEIPANTEGVVCVVTKDDSSDVRMVRRDATGTGRTVSRFVLNQSVPLQKREEFLIIPAETMVMMQDSISGSKYYYAGGVFINVYDEQDDRAITECKILYREWAQFKTYVTIVPKKQQVSDVPSVTLWSGETKHVFARGSYPTLDFVPDRMSEPLPPGTMCTFFDGENFTGTASETIAGQVRSMRVASSSKVCNTCPGLYCKCAADLAACPGIVFIGKLNGNWARMSLSEGEYPRVRMDQMRIKTFIDGAHVSLFSSPDFVDKVRGLIALPPNMVRDDIQSIIVATSKPCVDCSKYCTDKYHTDYHLCPCQM